MAKGSRGKVDADDYQSQSLSKKDQRKLKKLQEQITRAEQEDESDDEDVESEVDLEKLAASESESDLDSDDSEGEDSENDEEEESGKEDEEEAEEEEEEEDIPLSDVDVDSDADVVPHTKTTINNKAALRDALARIELPWSKHSFQEHQSIVSAEKTELSIKHRT